MRCPNCGGYVQDGAVFCTSCGAQTAPGPQGQWGAPAPPPVDPRMPQPLPSERSGALGLSMTAIVVVVVLVALAGVAAYMWFYIGEGEDNQSRGHVTLVLDAPSVNTRDIANVTHYDTIVDVDMVTPRDGRVDWSDVVVVVKDEDGQVLLQMNEALPDDPSSYDDADNGWVDVQVWYVDVDSDGVIDAGDAVKITGMNDRFEGCYIEMMDAGPPVDRIGSITLPTDFP